MAIDQRRLSKDFMPEEYVFDAADRKGEELGLSSDKVAFFDALEVNNSAVKLLGDAILKLIALELVTASE